MNGLLLCGNVRTVNPCGSARAGAQSTTAARLFAPATIQKFLANVDRREPDRCWLWRGKRVKDDYGQFYIDPSMPRRAAHRYALEVSLGRELVGGVVMHSCDTPACVNPAHLKHATPSQNTRDSIRKGRRPRQPVPHKWARSIHLRARRRHAERYAGKVA